MSHKYLRGRFNNEKFSDIKIVDKSGESVFAHKIILYQNKYFKTLLDSKVGSEKNVVVVDNIESAMLLIKFIYTREWEDIIDFLNTNPCFDEFLEFYDLYKMWLMNDQFLNEKIDAFVEENYERFIVDDFDNIKILSNYGFKYANEDLIKKNSNLITKEHIEKGLFYYDSEWFSVILVKFNLHEMINKKNISANLIINYLNPTLQQISLIKVSEKNKNKSKYEVICVRPLKIRIYELMGNVDGKSKKYGSVFVTPEIDCAKTNKLGIANSLRYVDFKWVSLSDIEIYTIKSIYFGNQECNEMFAQMNYSIGLELEDNILPYNGSLVCKVYDV